MLFSAFDVQPVQQAGLIFVVAHSPCVAIMKIVRELVLPIFGLDKWT